MSLFQNIVMSLVTPSKGVQYKIQANLNLNEHQPNHHNKWTPYRHRPPACPLLQPEAQSNA